MRTIPESILDLESQINQQKQNNKKSLLILDYYINDIPDPISSIVEYFNNRLISCNMKKCIVRNTYEITFWWD